MFREMRRKRQQLSQEECTEILTGGSSGVLAVSGDGGYPYAVPLSYVYHNGKLYFHCAKSGHKLDGIRRSDRVSFCVVAQDRVVPEEYTSHYKSVIAFGTARILEEEAEKYAAVEALAVKYHPADDTQHRRAVIERDYPPLCMIEMTIEYLTGKQAKELIATR